MATLPIDPVVPRPGAPRPTISGMTPPKVTGKSWLGVDPSQRMSTATAKEGIEGYLGRALTGPEIGMAVQASGYDDGDGNPNTFTRDWTGDEYNKILAEGARLTGNTFTPWSTTGGGERTGGIDPYVPPQIEAPPPPPLEIPEYQRRADFAFTGDNLADDPGYQRRQQAGEQALMHKAAASGNLRGGNFMRDLVTFNQDLASDEYDRAYGRAADTYDRNVGGDRYAHEAGVNRAQVQYAPQLLGWERNRDEDFRRGELEFDREWQREVYGRDDAWRRHQYANDDAWRRYELEEERRWRLANGGQV